MRHLQWLWTLILSVLFGLIFLPFNTLALPEDSVQFYFDHYGRADINDKWVRRVEHIFEQVKRVADKRHHRLPQLAFVEGFNSPDDPLAVALPDGYIVLSKQALDIIYKKVSPVLGDTRAAFVLGHELAHLANNDAWHREFLSVVRKRSSFSQLRQNRQQNKNKEIEADDQGFIYAAMAGYPVEQLLAKGGQHFFTAWEQQTFRRSDTHPPPEIRAQLLEARLQALLEILPYFHFGVRLSHFDRCDDGRYFLSEFLKNYPAREVYNNLGLCELQQARKALGKKAYLYWLPSMLDVTTQIDELSSSDILRGEGSTLADEFLSYAQDYFEKALEMGPSYLPAHVNLAITALYLGDIYIARATIEKARQLAPDDLEIQGLRLVILYEEGSLSPYVDMWPYIIKQLEPLAQQHNAPLSVVYNMARLLELRKRTGANKMWQRLAKQVADLPTPIRRIVCEKTVCPRPPRQKVPKASWDLPVKLGMDTRHNKTLREWQKNQMRLYDLYEEIYQHPEGKASVLAMRERVEMVVLKKREDISLKDLPDYCGQPLRERRVLKGRLLSCHNWAAWVVGEQVQDVWVVGTTNVK
ncbi:MAG: M48 family metalloprotease [Candidatus Parabeggiatoa sp.]|nr:M48 family metalloprotease [Candidatus Parabeggiatoa sp.]